MKYAKSALAGLLALFVLIIFALPYAVSAHEVYVLSPQEIAAAKANPSPNPFTAIPSQERLFLESGAIAIVVVLIALHFSVSKLFEKVFDPVLFYIKRFAPFICRITFGLALLASGYFRGFFGPELPMKTIFSPAGVHIVSLLFMVMGLSLLLGFLTRFMAAAAFVFFCLAIAHFHGYMLTYVNYLGEMIVMFIVGGEKWSFDSLFQPTRKLDRFFKKIAVKMEKHAFFILRLCFGTAVFYASYYAKFLHSNLALYTVRDYSLTNYFHFTPLFLVLGAFIIEALLGLCFATGFEIRFAALFYTFFLTISILFFGEAVWPHIILFGVNFAIFAHGYDKYTLEMALFQRHRRGEPVF